MRHVLRGTQFGSVLKWSVAQSAARNESTPRNSGESVAWNCGYGSKNIRNVIGARFPPIRTAAEIAMTTAGGAHFFSRRTLSRRRLDFQKSDRPHRIRGAAAKGVTTKFVYSLTRSGT